MNTIYLLTANASDTSEIATSVISAIGLIFSAISCISACIINKVHLNETKKNNLPNLKVLSITNTKSIPNASNITEAGHCRIQHGETTVDVSLSGKIATYKSEECDESGYIDEIKTNIKKVYLTYFSSKPHLVINHATDKDRFIVDHSDVKITFHNYGAKISALSILKFKIFYNDNIHLSSPLPLEGDKNNKITISPEENELFELYFDEVTTDLNNSMCQLVNPESYDSSPESIDLLKTHIPKNIFAYNKIEITAICWDLNNVPIEYLITIEHNGNFFISSTTLLLKGVKKIMYKFISDIQ